ncbi:MAG: hypothetical protein JNK77_11450 [Saprospiraceae bacterium]|nr:hypothetical protein [Saprospiraceae bacterium]
MKSKHLNRLLPLWGIVSALLAILLTIGCEVNILPTDDDLTSDPELEERFTAYTTFELVPADIYEQALAAGTTGSFEINIPLSDGQTWVAEVHQGNMLAEGFKAIENGPGGETEREVDIIALEGVIKETGAAVRFVVSRSLFGGAVVENDQIWYIDPITKHTKDRLEPTGQCVLYREQDVMEKKVTEFDHGYIQDAHHETYPDSPAPGTEERAANCWKLELRAHGDYEYYANKCGSNYNLAVYAIALNFGQAEAKFNAINLDFSILSIDVFTSTSNTLYYPTATDIMTLWQQTQYMWNANTANRDLVILFTGKNTTYLGYPSSFISYTASVCKSPSNAYAVLKTGLGSNLQVNTLARVIGVALGAGVTTSGIMSSPVPSGVASFSSTSINQMNWHLWFNNGCLHQGACW